MRDNKSHHLTSPLEYKAIKEIPAQANKRELNPEIRVCPIGVRNAAS